MSKIQNAKLYVHAFTFCKKGGFQMYIDVIDVYTYVHTEKDEGFAQMKC